MKIIDTRGAPCPMPIIMAKKALKECKADAQFKVITDNETTYNNLLSFIKDNKISAQSLIDGDIYNIIITKSGKQSKVSLPDEENQIHVHNTTKNWTVFVIKSMKMGDGDELLGIMLLDTFINSIKELDTLPDTIIFYNEGVKLLSEDSPASKSVKDLESKGVNIISCGTCVDYYKLKNKIKIGAITNMMTIAEILMSSWKVVYP